MDQTVDNSKSYWRQFFLGKLSLMPAADVRARSVKLQENLIQFLGDKTGVWATYYPMRKEFSPFESLTLMTNIRWTYPRTEDQKLHFYESKVSPDWTKNSLGVVEPPGDPREKIELGQHSGVLVPGLGFSRNGSRLGRGAGYYDQTLGDFKGLKVALAFGVQVIDDGLPTEFHDVFMDYIITDEEIIQCRKDN